MPKTEESRRLAHGQLMARRLRDGEDLHVYVRDLERLLDKAYPGLTDPLRSQQLLDQFLIGIPEAISHLLLVNPAADIATTVAKTRELMLLDARRGQLRGNPAVARAVVQDDTVSTLVRSLEAITSRLERLESRLGDKGNEVFRPEQIASQETTTKSTLGSNFRGKCFGCGQMGHRKFDRMPGERPARATEGCEAVS